MNLIFKPPKNGIYVLKKEIEINLIKLENKIKNT